MSQALNINRKSSVFADVIKKTISINERIPKKNMPRTSGVFLCAGFLNTTAFAVLLFKVFPYYIRMKIRLIAVFALLLFLLSCTGRELVREEDMPGTSAPESYPTKGIMHFMYGEIYRSGGNYAYANMEYQRALSYDTSTTILNAIAETYMLMGKNELARDYFEKTLYYDPDDQLANNHIINLYMQNGQYGKVIPVLEHELQKNPEDTDLLRKLAEALRRSKNYTRALEVLDRMIELQPDLPWSYVYAAEILLESDRIAEAAPYLGKAVPRLPPDDDLYQFWIRSLVENEDVPGMLKALESWMAADPETLIPYLFYSDQQIRLGNIDKADSVLSQIRQHREKDFRIPYLDGILAMQYGQADSVWTCYREAAAFPDADRNLFMRYGLWFWQRGETEQAETIAEEAIRRFGREARWLHMLALLHHRRGNSEAAEKLLTEVISNEPGNRGAREDLANIFLDAGRKREADSLYAALLDETPEDPGILNNYAYALAQMDTRLDAAMKMVDCALKEQKNAAYFDTKAWILYRQQKYRRSLRWVRKALQYPDAGSEVHYHHAKILMALRQFKAATAAINEALNINPQNIEALEAAEELEKWMSQ
jgi:tetratricopeptide (TPR) repeat protein